jgi:hypothetical protein
VFTISGEAVLNTSFLAAVTGLTFLCVNPLVKAVYVLRCFYGESLVTGEDLRAEWRARLPAALGLALILVFSGSNASAQAEATRSENAERLNESIERVLERPEFAWRFPRGTRPEQLEEDRNWLQRQWDSFTAIVKRSGQKIREWYWKYRSWVTDWLRSGRFRSRDRGGSDWAGSVQLLVFAVLAGVVCVLVMFLWRAWRRRKTVGAVQAQAVPGVPDVADERVLATELPADGWLRQARELMEAGELRLALRAMYLASLSHLAQAELIRVASFKSNRDYERELTRRARHRDELLRAFGENVAVFERSWYGWHEVTREMLARFGANVERIQRGE